MNLEFKITCKGLVNASVINDEILSLKLFVILSRDLQSITKRIEKVIKIYGLNPTEFAVLELLYSKSDQSIQKLGDKILFASSSITYVSITSEGIGLVDTIFPQHKEGVQGIFGSLDYMEKNDN